MNPYLGSINLLENYWLLVIDSSSSHFTLPWMCVEQTGSDESPHPLITEWAPLATSPPPPTLDDLGAF